jgi:hypothetical protein
MPAVVESIVDQTPIPSVARPSYGAFRALVALWAGAAALVALIVVAHRVSGRPYGDFTRDPDAVAGAPFYVGALSLAGLIAWGAGAAAAGLAAAVLWTTPPRREVLSLAFLSMFTLYLAADDALQLHEVVLPSHLGVPQDAVYAAYLLVAGSYLVLARSVILRTNWWLLGLALLAFATSIGMDLVEEAEGLPILVEDTAKLLGILTWWMYIAHTAFVELRSTARRS